MSRYCPKTWEVLFVSQLVDDSLVRLTNDKVFAAFAPVKLYQRSAILSIEKWVLSCEKQVQFIYDLIMLITRVIALDD